MTASEGSTRGMTSVKYGGYEHPLSFPRGRTALLVIDPVNDFLSEGGAAWDLTKITVEKHDVVGNLERAIAGARARDVPVLFAPMAYTEADYADVQLQRRSGINRLMFERKMFLAGSWGADFIRICGRAMTSSSCSRTRHRRL